MKRETIVLGAVGGVGVVVLAAALLMRSGGEASQPAQAGVTPGAEAAPAQPAAAEAEAANQEGSNTAAEAPAAPEASLPPSFTSEQNRREVTLFFQEDDSESLAPERRKIFLTSSIADQAKQIVGELITGPQGPGLLPTLPPQTRLRGLYLDRSGTAYVDLSGEVVDFHPGGTSEEIATIFSLVDSLIYNLPEIKRVHIIVNGEERDTLKNHLDLRRDFSKDMSIVDMDRKGAR